MGYLWGLAAAVALMVSLWPVSLVKRNASIIDIFWGFGFVLVNWIYLLGADSHDLRGWLVAGLVTAWGLRLTLHLLVRNWGKPEDYRYREMRQARGDRFAWISLFSVFLLQAVLLWIVSAPLYQVQHGQGPARLTWLDGLALVVFTVGLLFEAVGDWQLARFKDDPANRGQVLTSGLWRYTRHPNYFGDAMVWWGLLLFAWATADSWWVVIGPLLMTVLLMKVSGVALLERGLTANKPGYREYKARTNAFFPWFPKAHR